MPWDLVASLVAASLVGAVVARRSGRAVGVTLDALLSVGVPALLGARLAVILRDVALTGSVPPVAAWATITAGLSFPVALLIGLAVGARRLAQPATGAGAAITAAWAGMATWAAMSLVRDEVLGVAAPVPWGVPWPGVATAAVPVGLLEAVVLAGGLWWARRRHASDPAGLGLTFITVLAAVHLLGGVARPSLATVDRDLDVLLGLSVLVVAVAAQRARRRRATDAASAAPSRTLAVAGGLVGAALVAGVLSGPPPSPPTPSPATSTAGGMSLQGALTPGGSADDVPAWDGTDLAVFAAGAGRPLVVNLWASWCPPCHAEAPALARAARSLGDDVAFIGLLVDDETADGQRFVDRYDLPFPTVVDAGAAASLGYAGLPTTVILDADGTIVRRIIGGVDAGALASALQRTG